MKPKVVILSAFLSPLRSGAEACAEEVALALSEDFDFTIVTSRMRRGLPRRDMLLGRIPVIRVGFGCTFDKWLYPFLAPFVILRLRPDIVHAVLETFAGLALVFCFGYKRVLTLQTTNRSFLKRWILRHPDRVTAISSALRDVAAVCGRRDVTVIPNGIDVAAIQASVERHRRVLGRVLFVGRLERQKGVDTLLRALARAIVSGEWRVDSDGHLHVVGDGTQRKSLEHLAVELGISGHVTFLGYVPALSVYDEYAQAEIFCGLSRSEALGNVFLEAQAAGCAVLATNVHGIPEIVKDGETGLLVPPDDVASASASLQQLLNDTALRDRLSRAAFRNAEKYDWKWIAERYAEIYCSTLG